MWRLFVLAGCAVIALQLSTPTPVEAEPTLASAIEQLVTAEELEQYETALRAELATPSTRCARPVLRGTPRPGPAAADQRALIDRAPVADCLQAWQAAYSPDHDAITPKQREVVERCGAAIAAEMQAAITHEQACSGFALDAPPRTDDFATWPYLTVGKLVGLHARALADAGDPDEALWLLLETIRLAQDYARGRTNILIAMIATAMTSAALEHAHAILDRGSPANRDALIAALDRLLASEPAFGEAAAADSLFLVKESAPTPSAHLDRVHTLVFIHLIPPKILRACPADASLAACHRGLGRLIAVVPLDGTPRSLVLQALIAPEASLLAPSLRLYVAKRARSHAELIALRLHLEVLRRGCDRVALASLASTPALGDAVDLDISGDALVISPPVWTRDALTSATDASPLRVRCR